MKTAIVGGGAAGFFLAVNLKEKRPEMQVRIFERSHRVLAKVLVSGGGRCNCTNTFQEADSSLQNVYPRGHRLMKRLMKQFSERDAYQWFEQRGVPLVTQDDYCVFPRSQDSHSIVNLFLHEAQRLGVEVFTGSPVISLQQLDDYDFVVITSGGVGEQSLVQQAGFTIVPPVPSLFTFSIADERLTSLMGTVVEEATALIPGTKLRAGGPLLITHWGLSGPCILRLSSYAARILSDNGYSLPLAVNWTGKNESDVQAELATISRQQPQKQLQSVRPLSLPQRLWSYLVTKSLAGRANAPWGSLNAKERNRLVNILVNDTYQIAGRAPFKDEFVTCGGIDLATVNPLTLESRERPGVFFAGEVLDVDGITGGFNFQAAWTTAYAVAQALEAHPNPPKGRGNGTG